MSATPSLSSAAPSRDAVRPIGADGARVLGRLAGANVAAQLAEQITLAAVPLVAVTVLQAGPAEIAVLSALQTLPFLLLALPAGVLADRVSKRGLMAAAEGLRALAIGALLIALMTGSLSIPVLAVLGFIGATGTVVFSVAAPALVPTLIERSAWPAANARLELARSAALVGGPALAGGLVAFAGASPTFVLAAAVSIGAIVLMLRLPRVATPPVAARVPLRRQLLEGAGLVWRSPLLRPVVLTALFWNLAWFSWQVAYVPYAMNTLGLDAAAVGLTLAVNGVGMVVGAAAAPQLLRRLPLGLALLLGPVLSGLGMLAMAGTLLWPSGLLAALSFFLFGVGPVVWSVGTASVRQAVTPAPLLGRVSAIFLTANMGARPLGAALGGWAAVQGGATACLGLALAGFVIQLLIVAASDVRSLRKLPEAEGGVDA